MTDLNCELHDLKIHKKSGQRAARTPTGLTQVPVYFTQVVTQSLGPAGDR